jgi:hypothetical protein
VDESYHYDEVMLDYVPSFFIEVQGEPVWSQSFVFVELVDGF